MKKSSNLVFFGSGPVAAASLDYLARHFEIEAVVTKPLPEWHRGSAPVLEMAQKRGWKIYTPQNKNQLDAIINNTNFSSQCGVVVDFGIIVSKKVIDTFAKGIINSHFSLLPEWRGADPITFSILSGQPTTGVSLMLINEGLDEGQLLATEEFTIPEDMTTPDLTHKLVDISNHLLLKIIPVYLQGKITPWAQAANTPPTYSRKLKKEDGNIDWNKTAIKIERHIRAFIGWPQSTGVLTLPNNKKLSVIIAKAKLATIDVKITPGFVNYQTGHLLVGTSAGNLEILRLKIPGKREISSSEFARGYLTQ